MAGARITSHSDGNHSQSHVFDNDKALRECQDFSCVAGHLANINEANSAMAKTTQVDLGLYTTVNKWQAAAQREIAPTTVYNNKIVTDRQAELTLYKNEHCRGVSADACATQMLNNDKTAKILGELAYMAVMMTPVGVADDTKTLTTGTGLDGEEANRALALFGVLTAGEGTAITKALQKSGDLVKLAKTAVEGSPEAAKLTKELEIAALNNPHVAAAISNRSDISQVKRVDAGSKGNWSKTANGKLDPNTGYVLDNGHAYVTDAEGKVKEVVGELKDIKMDRNGHQQCVTGKCGNAGDEGGHLIASSLGGAGDRINIVPQEKMLNRNDWRNMEKYFTQQLKDGKTVNVKIDVGYPAGGGARPNQFTVIADIGGKPYKRVFQQ